VFLEHLLEESEEVGTIYTILKIIFTENFYHFFLCKLVFLEHLLEESVEVSDERARIVHQARRDQRVAEQLVG